jgi:hypothetical protein
MEGCDSMSESKLEKLRELSAKIADLVDQEKDLQDQFDALEPTFQEWIESGHPKWRGGYAHYSKEHDILHAYFENRAAVTIAGHHLGRPCIAVADEDHDKVVGCTWWGFRAAIEKMRAEKP